MEGPIYINNRHFHLLILSLVLIRISVTLQTPLGSVSVGAMLSSNSMDSILQEIALEVNTNTSQSPRFNFSLSILSTNPVRAALDVCEKLVTQKVYAIIVSRPANSHSPPIAVSYTCGFYQIPVVGISTRESVFSDKVMHQSFLRTVPPYSDQANVWLALLRYFRWNKVILVTSNDHDSRVITTKLTSLAVKHNIHIEKSIVFSSGTTNVTSELLKIQKSQSRVILFSASEEDAAVVYKDASWLGITGKGNIWIVTQQAMSGAARPYLPQGTVGIQLRHGDDERAQLRDAVRITVEAVRRLVASDKKISEPPSSCHETQEWTDGEELYRIMVNTSLPNGETGEVKFNSNGDRMDAVYDIVNIKSSDNKDPLVVGRYKDNNIVLNDTIKWPGGVNTTPEGIFVSNHLMVTTMKGHPFVYVTDVPKSGRCEDLNEDKKKHVQCKGGQIHGGSSVTHVSDQEHCCYGFCIDLLIRLGEKVNFTYSVHLSKDGNYGSLTRVNGSDTKKWNGMVGEVIDGHADLIVAALTINNERAQWLEFSKPFKYQGLTILVRKESNESKLDSFLRPFQTELWLLVLLSVHVVAFILYLLDRFSPFGRFKLARKEKEETALNLSSAMWFSWGVLLNSGIGEGTPRSFSARVLGMVWAGFAMIIVASYTANLAAFLVLDRPKAVVSGIADPNLRNPSERFKYATVANTSVDAYFRRQVELSSMYTFMEKYNVKTAREGINKVKNGELMAFIWDSPVLYYESSMDCSLTTAGELFGRSGYGIGMPKGSPWSHNISLAILNFHESGVMEELETTWIDTKNCEDESNSPATLGLSHMLGVFIMVAAGIGAGIVIIILEILYHKHRGWKEEQKELAKKTTDKWRANIMMIKRDKAKSKTKFPNGVVDSAHPEGDGISRRNPIYNPENHTEAGVTFSYN